MRSECFFVQKYFGHPRQSKTCKVLRIYIALKLFGKPIHVRNFCVAQKTQARCWQKMKGSNHFPMPSRAAKNFKFFLNGWKKVFGESLFLDEMLLNYSKNFLPLDSFPDLQKILFFIGLTFVPYNVVGCVLLEPKH